MLLARQQIQRRHVSTAIRRVCVGDSRTIALAVIVLRQELLTVIQRYIQLCSSTSVLTTICLIVQHQSLTLFIHASYHILTRAHLAALTLCDVLCISVGNTVVDYNGDGMHGGYER